MPTDLKPAKRIRDTRLVANFSVRASSCAVCGAGRSAGLSAHTSYREAVEAMT